MKSIKRKLLSVGITSLSVMPLLSSCNTNTSVTTIKTTNDIQETSNDLEEEGKYACTVAYVGKNCSANGQAFFARATDCNPKAVNLKLKHFNANELAGKTIEGKLGMKYKMPDKTLAYTSCPLSDKTCDKPAAGTGMWENNGINELGVGVSATLTCTTNPKIAVSETSEKVCLPEERFVDAGVGEELLPTIMAAQATSAKHAMQIAAAAIDQFGAQDANIIFAVDQNESWMMEIYSRHQYCAVKVPDDKVFVAGNEFILDSLYDLGINENNKDDLCITSPGLLTLVTEDHPEMAKWISGTSETEHDIFHLDLFNTYAAEGTGANDGTNVFDPICHMRTWRGYSMFDRTVGLTTATKYEANKKYAPFLTPKNDAGDIRKDLTVYDVMDVYRDEFDELIDPQSPRLDPTFVDVKQNDPDNWRPIAVQTTRAIHIMSSDPNKPKWMAANEWYTPSSGNYAPFLQINNAMTSIDGEFGYYPERFSYDKNCSSVIYRELNKLAWYDRTNYGLPLQSFWREFETIYCTQMQQVIDDAAKLSSEDDAKSAITNFNKHVRDEYVAQIKKTTDDLMWHIMKLPRQGEDLFVPLIDLETYVKELGWSNYNFDGSKATFERNLIKCTYTISDGVIHSKGNLKLNDGTSVDLDDSIVDGKVYVGLEGLNSAIKGLSEIRTINVNDYVTKSSSINHLAWIIPVTIVVAAGIGVGIYFLVRNKKKNKIAQPTEQK